MENLTASQVAHYVKSGKLDFYAVMDKLPVFEGAHALIGKYRVTCTDDIEMRYTVELDKP